MNKQIREAIQEAYKDCVQDNTQLIHFNASYLTDGEVAYPTALMMRRQLTPMSNPFWDAIDFELYRIIPIVENYE